MEKITPLIMFIYELKKSKYYQQLINDINLKDTELRDIEKEYILLDKFYNQMLREKKLNNG
jgi:hypothetical protein